MKKYLYPNRVWLRLLVWQILLSVVYALLLLLVCHVVDALEPTVQPDHPRYIVLPRGFFVFVWGLLVYPVLLLLAWLAAWCCPHRQTLRVADHIALALSLLFILMFGVWIYGIVFF